MISCSSSLRGMSALALILALQSGVADAGTLTRAWVSSAGADSGACGPIATPCRTLNGALANVASGAEIDVKDPGAYGPGPIVINHAVSIVNDGVGAAGVQATSGDIITINAGASDIVTIRGLDIDGLGGANTGITVNSGGTITVASCVIRRVTGVGLYYQPTNQPITMLVSNTTIADNSNIGLLVQPVNGTNNLPVVMDRLTVNNNSSGIVVGYSHSTLSNSVISNNVTGVSTENAGSLWLAKNVIAGNTTGVANFGGPISSYGDNYFDSNGADTSGAVSSISTR